MDDQPRKGPRHATPPEDLPTRMRTHFDRVRDSFGENRSMAGVSAAAALVLIVAVTWAVVSAGDSGADETDEAGAETETTSPEPDPSVSVSVSPSPSPTPVYVPGDDGDDGADAEDGGGSGASSGGDAELPSEVFDLANWKVTLPIGDDGDPTEIVQPELDGFSDDEYFTVADSGDAIRFRTPVNGVTTENSSYPRSELREMEPGGGDEIEWDAGSGEHVLTVTAAFTHLPAEKSEVVGAQIHGGDDDVTALRLEGSELWLTDGDETNFHLVTDSYELGTVFEFSYVVSDGEIAVYYDGELQTTLDYDGSGNYFKAGAYTQANCENSSPCSDDNYGEVVMYDLAVSHS
ncbi:polysaccharide lyase family 7 protein [Glycomyces sp. MUSA5-2]|uniref:polysaccharide lyase family 7 protein n=1 Tax=Glycomyces sp. MUSA5-2 TaxID=2053002 RepID=UPI00300A14B7